MKRIVFLTVVISLLANCTYSAKHPSQYRSKDLIIISGRVGEVIDVEEREYFNLLSPEIYLRPVTYRYKSATLHAIDVGGYEVRISTTTDTLVAVIRDHQGIEILGDYIDNYEAVVESRRAFEDKWGVIDYDRLGLPITKNEMQITEKRVVAVKKSQSLRLRPVMIGASLGGCLGGVVAFLVTDRETEYEFSDPGAEGVLACFERTSIALAYLAGIAIGSAAGGILGCVAGRFVQETEGPDFEESIILDTIKESRKPRVLK